VINENEIIKNDHLLGTRPQASE